MQTLWLDFCRSKSKVFFCCSLSFIAGVVVGNFFICPPVAVFCLLLFFCASAISLGLFFDQRHRLWRCCLIFACCLLLGFWRYGVSLPDYGDQSKIYHYVSSTQEFFGAVRTVDNRLGGQKLTVAVEGLRQAGKIRQVSGLALITAPLYPEYHYGDQLKIKCFLKPPGLIEDFDYGRYLAKSGIFVYCGFADINTAVPAGWSPVGLFFDFKKYLLQSLNAAISEPEVSLLRGILLGDGRGLPEKYAQMFSDLGLTHIIAISGDHIAIIAVVLLELLLVLGWSRPKAFWPMALMIAFYVALVGAPASAVRSAIMALAVMYAKKIGRASRVGNVLVLTAALMILVNPAILLADVGFQLSFLAICGLSYVSPLIAARFKDYPDLFRTKEILIATLGSQITTLPLLVYYFGKLSVISLGANVLILPIISFLTVYGLFNLAVAAVCLPLGRLSGWVSWLFLAYWLKMAEWLHAVPYGYFTIDDFPWPVVALYYIVLAGWLNRGRLTNFIKKSKMIFD